MKKFNKKLIISVIIASFVSSMIGLTEPKTASAVGPSAVNLFSAENFSIISKAGITNTGSHASLITGNIGSSPISSTGMDNVFCSEITGTIYGVDAAYVGSGDQSCYAGNPPLSNKTLIDNAVLDMGIAYTDAAGRTAPDGVDLYAGHIGGQTFTAGLYKWNTDVDVATDVTLDGGASDVWIFQISGNLTLAAAGSVISGTHVILLNGAKAENVFWQVGGLTGATLGTYATFNGNILSAKQIILETGAILNGRALAQSQVTLDSNMVSIPSTTPATLHVIKQVVNNSTGTATSSDFTLRVKLSGVDVATSTGTTTPGTAYTLPASTYTVTEDANAGYIKSYSGDCDSTGKVTLASGSDKTCIVTNTDIPAPATLHIIKLVVNTNSATSVASDFNLHVKNSGVDVAGSPAVGVGAPGTTYSLNAGTYNVSEDANSSYTKSFSGDCDSSGNVVLSAGSDKTCTVVNTSITVSSGGGGGGPSPVISIIGITKIPTPLALASAGSVTYNYNVWNVGKQRSIASVIVVDDKCGPVTLVSGDVNKNFKIEADEVWKYSCTTNLSRTTTNTAVATGKTDDPYQQVTVATAIATVVVGNIPAIVSTTTPINTSGNTALTAPLINIVKVPSRLTPFPFGGGNVIYTYTVTNPGIISMNDVKVIDDKCAPLTIKSGDANKNNLLDPNEVWVYTCQMKITTSTKNIATASGRANGFTALGYAFANVLVTVPGLPNTGVQEKSTPWKIIIPSGLVIIALASLAVVLKKRKA